MNEVILMVEIEFEPDRAEEGFAALEELCAATHANEPGASIYAFHRVADDPNRAVTIEKWDPAALEAHGSTEHVQAFLEFDGMAGAPRILSLEPTGFGEPEKGLL